MPNWCFNTLYIQGPQEDLDNFYDGIKSFKEDEEDEGGDISIFNSYIPMPIYGANCDWQMSNWGCKWGDCSTTIEDSGQDCLEFKYDTPNTPGNIAVLNISKQFPTLQFYVEYAEPNMNFRGFMECEAGAIIKDAEWRMSDYERYELGYDCDED